MSHQVITRMAYNAKTKQIETWQHSNNVWPTTDHFYALDVKTDEQMFEFITLIANGLWQGRKWRKAFKTLFEEYPELVRSSYEHELRGQPWKAYCAICKKYEELAQSKCNEIVARFRQLTGIVYLPVDITYAKRYACAMQHTPCEFQCGICLVFLAQPVESHQRDLSV